MLPVVLLMVIAAMAQRIAGLGFAMLVSPFIVLLLGPHHGIVLVNLCGVFSSAMILRHVWRNIAWRRYWWLIVPALVGSVPGSLLANGLPTGPLNVVVGGVVLAALATTGVLSRRGHVMAHSGPRSGIFGFFSGFSNALSGVGGPMLTAYAELTRWKQKEFAATLQPFFMVAGAFSATTKVLADHSTLPTFAWWQWIVLAVGILAGVQLGNRLAPRIHDVAARRFVLGLAVLGAVIAIAKGIADTVGG